MYSNCHTLLDVCFVYAKRRTYIFRRYFIEIHARTHTDIESNLCCSSEDKYKHARSKQAHNVFVDYIKTHHVNNHHNFRSILLCFPTHFGLTRAQMYTDDNDDDKDVGRCECYHLHEEKKEANTHTHTNKNKHYVERMTFARPEVKKYKENLRATV